MEADWGSWGCGMRLPPDVGCLVICLALEWVQGWDGFLKSGDGDGLTRGELEHDKDIKDFVFRKGEFMEDVADVASIALRNVVFEHKGIDIEKYRD